MKKPKENKDSKTLIRLPRIVEQYVKDDSLNSKRRCEEVIETLFQMMVYVPKRGRPSNVEQEEILDAA